MLHLTWLKKAQDVYLDIGCDVSANGVELSIAQGLEEKPKMLEYTRKLYNENEYMLQSLARIRPLPYLQQTNCTMHFWKRRRLLNKLRGC